MFYLVCVHEEEDEENKFSQQDDQQNNEKLKKEKSMSDLQFYLKQFRDFMGTVVYLHSGEGTYSP